MGSRARSACVLLVVLAVGSRAQAAPPAERRASYQTATGTLTAYDTVTRVLTVLSASGSKEFHVATDARLWLGSRRVPVSQLSVRAGAQVTVAWSDVDGVRTTHTVRVSETRPVRAK